MYFIISNTFTLTKLNERLLNFNFGYSEKDKPLPILSIALKQMLVLVPVLSFLIADKILQLTSMNADQIWLRSCLTCHLVFEMDVQIEDVQIEFPVTHMLVVAMHDPLGSLCSLTTHIVPLNCHNFTVFICTCNFSFLGNLWNILTRICFCFKFGLFLS